MRILKIVAHVLPRERDVNANGKGGWFSWFFQRRRKAGLEGRSLRETRRVARLFCDETSRKNRRLRGKRWESARGSSAKMRQVAWIVAFSNPFKSRTWSCREYKWRARNSLVRLLGENGNFGLALIPNHHLITVRFTSVASPVFKTLSLSAFEKANPCVTLVDPIIRSQIARMYTFTRLTCRWCVGVSRYREAPKGMAVITELRFVENRFARCIVSNKIYVRGRAAGENFNQPNTCSDFANLISRYSISGRGFERRRLMENHVSHPRRSHHSSSLKPWRNSIAKPCGRSASFRVHIPFRPCPFFPLKRADVSPWKVDRNDESDAIKFDPLQSFLRRPVIRYLGFSQREDESKATILEVVASLCTKSEWCL